MPTANISIPLTGFLSEWLCCCHPLTLYFSTKGGGGEKQTMYVITSNGTDGNMGWSSGWWASVTANAEIALLCGEYNHSKSACVGTGSRTGAGSTGTAQDGSGWFLKWTIIEFLKAWKTRKERGREGEKESDPTKCNLSCHIHLLCQFSANVAALGAQRWAGVCDYASPSCNNQWTM